MNEEKAIIIKVSKEETVLPFSAYAEIILAVPAGFITTEKAVLDYASEKTGNAFETVSVQIEAADYPYWRIVTPRGSLSADDKQEQKSKLEAEGLTVVTDKRNAQKVENYKEHLFELNQIQITAARPRTRKPKESKKVTFEAECNIGDPIYWVEEPDYDLRHERVMQFKIKTGGRHDNVEMILFTESGVTYYYDENSFESDFTKEDDLAFFDRQEANEFIKEHFTEFNSRKFRFGTVIYTKNGEEKLLKAEYDDGQIYFVTEEDSRYLWTDEGKTFSFDPKDYTGKYHIIRFRQSGGKVYLPVIIGDYSDLQSARKALKKLRKKVGEENNLSRETADMFTYMDGDRAFIVQIASEADESF